LVKPKWFTCVRSERVGLKTTLV